MENKQPMSEIIKETIDKTKSIADAKTVIGDPISLVDGITIVPISKVSVGASIGGGEYGSKKNKKKENNEVTTTDNFGGGGGIGITVTPVAFLVITPDGEAKILNVGENTGYIGNTIAGAVNGIDAALAKAPEIIDKVKNLFGGKKKKTEEKVNDTEPEVSVVFTDEE